MMVNPYHEGELAVQGRAGTLKQARGMARTIKPVLPDVLKRFLQTQRWVVLGAADDFGDVWASMVVGEPGFVHAADDLAVAVAGHPLMGDPLHGIGLQRTATPVGMLMIDFARRMRARINGRLHRNERGLRIDVEQAYANCAKYIQRREVSGIGAVTPHAVSRSVGEHLTIDQAAALCRADTAFIATVTASHGADASHRGGPPGFLSCSPDRRRIEFLDYPGNGMFNTLGNLELDDRAGLTVPDFDTGAILELSGRAHLAQRPSSGQAPAGTLGVVFTVDRVVELSGALPFTFSPVEYSPALRAVTDAAPSAKSHA